MSVAVGQGAGEARERDRVVAERGEHGIAADDGDLELVRLVAGEHELVLALAEVVDGVVAEAALEVEPVRAADGVVDQDAVAPELVVAAAAMELVVAADSVAAQLDPVPIELVVARAAAQHVLAATCEVTEYRGIAVELIVTAIRREQVVAGAARAADFAATLAQQQIAQRTADQLVVAADARPDQVAGGIAHQKAGYRRAGSVEKIVTAEGAAEDGVVGIADQRARAIEPVVATPGTGGQEIGVADQIAGTAVLMEHVVATAPIERARRVAEDPVGTVAARDIVVTASARGADDVGIAIDEVVARAAVDLVVAAEAEQCALQVAPDRVVDPRQVDQPVVAGGADDAGHVASSRDRWSSSPGEKDPSPRASRGHLRTVACRPPRDRSRV